MSFKLKLNNRFTEALPADPVPENYRRQVEQACFSWVSPKKTSNPKVLHISPEMLAELGISEEAANSLEFLKMVSGNSVLPNSKPFAMCYGGHQFGHWAGQLGDGRAINLGEVASQGKHWMLQLKGAGPTPYSRSADGLAVLRSSIREYLCSEAMYHLGVPTTRALSLVLTGDQVLRDVMYDGHPEYEKGAIVCRVSPTFLRFGNYEIFAARNDVETLKTLVDFTIAHHFPELDKPSKETYLKFFETVAKRSLDLVMHWQRVGFVHGVLNTDNMSILGLTIDYGPYGWLEGYDHGWTPNTTDREFKRYRFGAQPSIVHWNLFQLANALYTLVEEAEGFEQILNDFKKQYQQAFHHMMKAKLGLFSEDETTLEVINELENVLHLSETDMTIFFRLLGDVEKSSSQNGLEVVKKAFYAQDEISGNIKNRWEAWFQSYTLLLQKETLSDMERKTKMNKTNPKYVLRNYMAQLAIDAADKEDYGLLDELFTLLKKPYDEQPEYEKWFAKRPDWARHKVGCSMLSCSS